MEKLLIPLALLPIVAGYVFASTWEITRYRLARSDGQELYFKSAYYGYTLALVSFSVFWLTDRFVIGLCPARGDCFLQLISIAFVLCLLLAKPFACYLNLFTDSDIYWQSTLYTELEKLLLFSVLDSKPIMVSLNNNKVYIGYAVGVADPSHRHDRKWIQLFLILSGYRDAQSKVHYTLNYSHIAARLDIFKGSNTREAGAQNQTVETQNDKADTDNAYQNFMIALPVSEIISVHRYDEQIALLAQQDQDTAQTETPDDRHHH